jgi:hypothetical protein
MAAEKNAMNFEYIYQLTPIILHNVWVRELPKHIYFLSIAKLNQVGQLIRKEI